MKRVFATGLAILMALSFNSGTTLKALDVSNQTASTTTSLSFQIANEDRLIEMLRANGTILKNDSGTVIEQKVKDFLAKKSKQFDAPGQLASKEAKRQGLLNEKLSNFVETKSKGGKNPGLDSLVDPVIAEAFDGTTTEDRVLAILINFPDYDGSTLTPNDTDMYYDDYTIAHYEDLLFGDSYEGPNGEDFISMKSYYEDQSGGAYSVTGKVAGWYTAKHPAAYYGANDPDNDNDMAARELVMEALMAVAKDKKIKLSYFDQEDRYDLDGDGDLREPDGLIDHLMIFHASVGEEAGGGQLGTDAIWSHRWNLGGVYTLPVRTKVPYWENQMAAYDYTIQPIDAAAGVCAHEYGHDLGLPDEYDTEYTGMGEPVSYWSIMSSGSWAGAIPGTEPTGFSPYAKEFFAATIHPRWFGAGEVSLDDLAQGATSVLLDEASTKGNNFDGLRINIPDKVITKVQPLDGDGFYYSTSGNDLDLLMYTQVSLPQATSISLNADIFYEIEQDWDYGYAFVQDAAGNFVTLAGNITTTEDPNGQNPGNGITGNSGGWTKANFDLSIYAGQTIYIGFGYWTDSYVAEYGLGLDRIEIIADDQIVLSDSNQSAFTLSGFDGAAMGEVRSSRYYLVEWRNHSGVDQGLGHIRRGSTLMSYDPGMVVWYVDNGYDDNHVGYHPGYGYLGVVDSSQQILRWNDGEVATTKYQIHDAAFNTSDGQPMYLDYTAYYGYPMTLEDTQVKAVSTFYDKDRYISPLIPDAGKILPTYGLKLEVLGASEDQSVGLVRISVK